MTIADAYASAFAAGLAELTPVISAPSGALGYGCDLDCAGDITEDAAEIDARPDDPEACRKLLGQALYRRLITAQGALVDDRDYGLGLAVLVNKATSTASLQELSGRIRQEMEKDDRVDQAIVQLTTSAGETGIGTNLTISIRVFPEDPNVGPFSLVLAVTDGTVLLNAIDTEAEAVND